MATNGNHLKANSSTIEALRSYSTCDISDALQGLGQDHGGFIAGPTVRSPDQQVGSIRIVGRAYTVQYVPISAIVEQPTGVKGHYIDNVPPGSVVFVHNTEATANALYGGMMSRRAKARGAVGTVVCGRVRDLEEHRNLEYPVFATGVGTASPYGVARVGEINGDICVRGEGQEVLVRPGDYLICDLNGVVCLPVELVEGVLELAANGIAQDAKVATDLMAGVGFVEASGRHRSKK